MVDEPNILPGPEQFKKVEGAEDSVPLLPIDSQHQAIPSCVLEPHERAMLMELITVLKWLPAVNTADQRWLDQHQSSKSHFSKADVRTLHELYAIYNVRRNYWGHP